MKDICTVLCLLSVLAAGCLSTQHESDSGPISVAHLGKRVTVEGKAVNRKIGALLVTPSSPVWIEGLSGWPKGYYSNNTKL